MRFAMRSGARSPPVPSHAIVNVSAWMSTGWRHGPHVAVSTPAYRDGFDPGHFSRRARLSETMVAPAFSFIAIPMVVLCRLPLLITGINGIPYARLRIDQ